MLTILDMYRFAEQYHFPRFQCGDQRIAASERAWLLFLATATTDELATVAARITRHVTRMAAEEQQQNDRRQGQESAV